MVVRVLNRLDDVPVIDRVTTKTPFGLSTAGGEEVIFHGRNLGPAIAAAPDLSIDITASYFNGNHTFYASGCQIQEAFTRVSCISAPGHGAGFQWQVKLRNVLESDPSNDTLSYASPSIIAFTGDAASDAVTTGHQAITIRYVNGCWIFSPQPSALVALHADCAVCVH